MAFSRRTAIISVAALAALAGSFAAGKLVDTSAITGTWKTTAPEATVAEPKIIGEWERIAECASPVGAARKFKIKAFRFVPGKGAKRNIIVDTLMDGAKQPTRVAYGPRGNESEDAYRKRVIDQALKACGTSAPKT